jgi:hypothetical protein
VGRGQAALERIDALVVITRGIALLLPLIRPI